MGRLIHRGDTATCLQVTNLGAEDDAAADANLVGPASFDLYAGTGGIAVFLAYLGHVAGDARYTEASRALLREIIATEHSAFETRPMVLAGCVGIHRSSSFFRHSAFSGVIKICSLRRVELLASLKLRCLPRARLT